MVQRPLFDRRQFVRQLGAAALVVPFAAREAHAAIGAVFTHGVASGDPQGDRVILWTRVAVGTAPEPVAWEIARDAAFTQVLRRGRALARPQADGTVKVDALGLPHDTQLFYRFSARGQVSPVGRTKTLSLGGLKPVRLAVFSCANYPAGYFHAYGEAARMGAQFDAAVHLGDYLYEYGRGGYASEQAAALGREVEPAHETVLLDDYRQRYAQYRSDPDLQAAHAAMPWICVWDDHEIANDTWREGAENHDASEGDFAARRAAALQAWHEWMPVRAPDASRPDAIYRRFRFGNLVDLLMLDTRVIGRDRQLDYPNYVGASGFDAARFQADMADPSRQMLGAEQMAWLTQTLSTSSSIWTMLGQQVLMGRMDIPAPLVLGQISFSAYSALVAKAQTAPGSLTPQELALLAQPSIPYNLDAWDGYTVAREQVLGLAGALQKNLVVLSGDTHNAWASDLATLDGRVVGVEFATPGVSSPGLEAYFPSEDPAAVAAGLTQIIGPLRWADTANRGFMVVNAMLGRCEAHWHFVSTVKAAEYTLATGPTWITQRGLPGLTGGTA